METAQIIRDFEAHKAAPIAEARKALASLRAEVIRLEQESNTVRDRVLPGLETAQKLYAYAAGQGIQHLNLGANLREAFGDGQLPGVLSTIPGMCSAVVGMIDGLTESDLVQNVPKSISLHVANIGRCLGALQTLATTIER